MYNETKFKQVLAEYKKVFPTPDWKVEVYKWEAVQHFQEHWDIEASDFYQMVKTALSKTSNLLTSYRRYPIREILKLIKSSENTLREMFSVLFNESLPLDNRINNFLEKSNEVYEEYGEPGKYHHQDINAISTYLWLKYPDKYYIYKFSVGEDLCKILENPFIPKSNGKIENVIEVYKLYDEISSALKEDEELQEMVKTFLSDKSYPDPESKTLAVDFGYFTSIKYKEAISEVKEDSLENFDMSNIEQNEDEGTGVIKYTKQDFLKDVYLEEDKYIELVNLLDIKKNIILQGAPGVGKTFMAKRLAYSILGEKDDDKIEVVQFHQNYSYEDFVMGYKPIDDGFKLENGIFYKFCKKANENPGSKYFFIIDEINRGNLSKVFGELLMLIEADKRGEDVSLAYSKESFSVPKNLYIIGMMNTADRSLAMIDYALRRRFSFFEMEPAFRSTGFKAYQNKLNHDRFDRLIKKVEDLNNAIEEDSSLGRGFCIGHSYFCGRSFSDDEWIRLVINYDILPMLKEYYFDDESSYEKWERELLGILDE